MSRSTQDAQAKPHPMDDQASLFNKINEMHCTGLGALVDLPQLLTCGNEASDKHATVEAITRVSLPANDSDTRFVTEIRLRCQPEQLFRITIRPKASSSHEHAPTKPIVIAHTASAEESPALIEKASELIRGNCNQEISEEVLELDIAGPDQPNLILVDLPGLDHTGVGDKAQEGGDCAVEVARKYMKNPQSIILAILSADLPTKSQKVLDIAAEIDPKQERTLGIITHPRAIVTMKMQVSDSVLSEITQRKLRLGWLLLPDHILGKQKTLPVGNEENNPVTLWERDWEALGKCANSVENLTDWLNDTFAEHIKKGVPELVLAIDAAVSNKKSMLPELTLPRETLGQQRTFLFSLSNTFECILRQAISGAYSAPFFDTRDHDVVADLADPRRLRAIIRALSQHFANAIDVIGCRRKIVEPDKILDWPPISENPYPGFRRPQCLTRAEFEHQVSQQIQRDGISTVVGNPDELLVGALFRDQTQPWGEIAHVHLITAWKSVRDCVVSVLQYLTDQETADHIMQLLIDPELKELKINLLEKLEELTAYNKRGRLLPVTPSVLANVEKYKSYRLRALYESEGPASQGLAISGAQSGRETRVLRKPSTDCTTAEAIDLLQAHYDAAMTTFIDNVSILAVENCLLGPLPCLLTAEKIGELDDAYVQELGMEPRSAVVSRERLNAEINMLQPNSQALKEFIVPDLPLPVPSVPGTDSSELGAALMVSSGGQPFLVTQEESHRPNLRDSWASNSAYSSQGLFGALKTPKATAPVVNSSSGTVAPQHVSPAPGVSTLSPGHPRHLETTPTTLDFPSVWCFREKDGVNNCYNQYQNLVYMSKFTKFSQEELRFADYLNNLSQHRKT
ncbi:unnamed protein product [Penicillium salamii]|uniref:GED domain-containing protein n=1 Tax=Penicillium salamii TaxID=1612424 RepID=A0A9W4N862_9EURO|nr:unnamed protein product [Penicillium salamii]CAG8083261.1 unnamed protein product [Penicillium salamii]CAG8100215.1 unnamed protein product [Penicillium salamii]CAG8106154.1 unnamed protein product [Penicillium salamii]CAG8116433.1 unnamed protein product [Penicillium salamii]